MIFPRIKKVLQEGSPFNCLKNCLIVLNLMSAGQIQNNDSILEYLEGLKKQPLS